MIAARPPKILFLVSEDWYFCSHRLPVARAARDQGWEVVVLTRLAEHEDMIRAEGFRPVPLLLRRGSRHPGDAIRTIRHIAGVYRQERPDLVHHVNLKMCLLGGVAARMAGVPRVVNGLTGMGFLFAGDSLSNRMLRSAVLAAFRPLSRWDGAHLIVQNGDDLAFLQARAVAVPGRTHLIRGSGVDVDRFRPAPEPEGVPMLTYVGRMLADKGLNELAAAARLLHARGRDCRVVLVGPTDPENPQSLDPATLEGWQKEGILEWWGRRDDIPAVWAESTVAVLPSYREGLPKALLEAAAAGRPLIAADVPGCRDLVRDGVDGILVPPRDPEALADAIDMLLQAPDLRVRYGASARQRATAEFSEAVITAQTLEVYTTLLGDLGRRDARAPAEAKHDSGAASA
ncbi:MAG: glycosyltransferase family 1 protein [Rhodospirillales bacterium]|nr:MAG: glycosyltransferase family 1 protein [Rhodospirillales bacterium]